MSLVDAQPLRLVRQTAASAIYGELRRQILAMKRAPGSPISEKELAEAFGVSRTPVREALIRLAEEGLVQIQPQSGTRVGLIPIDALPDAVVVRQALECAMVRILAARATDAEVAQLREIIRRQEIMSSLGDADGFHALDEAFHETIADLAGHPGVWKVAHQAKSQIDRCRRMTLPVEGRMRSVVNEHRTILDGIADRTPARAVGAMERHLSAVLPDARDLKERFPDFFT
jgi:GntR family transcriptional regulator, rspAB operon transcriptional repressor